MLHADQSRRRFDQTASRLRSLVHPARTAAARIEVSEQTGRGGWAAARGLRYREARLGEEFGPLWATYWFRVELIANEEWDGRPVHLIWDSGCEATLWRDGLPAQGLNAGGRAARKAAPLSDAATAGERFEVQVEMACNPWTGMPLPAIEGLDPAEIEGRRLGSAWVESPGDPVFHGGPARLREVSLAVFDPEAWELHWDFEVLRQLEAEHDRGLDPHQAGVVFAALERFCNEWESGDRSGWGGAGEILREPLAETGPERNHRVFAVGHTHLDTGWLWPFAETRRKFVRSVANQLALLDRYPEHRFSAPAAQHYAWLKQDAPELFERVRELVAEGRWSVVGGSWVEPDCNMPSGESLVRQYLYGQRWFERELGVRCREHWGPDNFGHTGALPQILRAVGIDRWLSQKLSWNQFTEVPHHSFVWEGIDGTTVLAHMPPSNTCNAEMKVRQIRESVARFRDSDRSEISLMMFGYGDGGGGPDPGMVETATRLADLRGMPRVELGSSQEFFEKLDEDAGAPGENRRRALPRVPPRRLHEPAAHEAGQPQRRGGAGGGGGGGGARLPRHGARVSTRAARGALADPSAAAVPRRPARDLDRRGPPRRRAAPCRVDRRGGRDSRRVPHGPGPGRGLVREPHAVRTPGGCERRRLGPRACRSSRPWLRRRRPGNRLGGRAARGAG